MSKFVNNISRFVNSTGYSKKKTTIKEINSHIPHFRGNEEKEVRRAKFFLGDIVIFLSNIQTRSITASDKLNLKIYIYNINLLNLTTMECVK
jgi:hypothetical protein